MRIRKVVSIGCVDLGLGVLSTAMVSYAWESVSMRLVKSYEVH